MKVTMYTTHCPKCKLLTVKLEGLGIEINEVTDVELMKEKGFTTVPMLEVDGNIMDFSAAYKWANEIKEKKFRE